MSGEVIPSNPEGSPNTPVFLVLERDSLIAEDIAGSLKDLGPCETIHIRDAEDLMRHLNTDIRVSAVFLELRAAQVVEMGLDRRLADHGARIILTVGEDDAPTAMARGWSMLVRPFTDQMIRESLIGPPKGA
jgi:hypothetical protein